MRLEARGLGRSFGPVRALDGVDFHVDEGEVLAVLRRERVAKKLLHRQALAVGVRKRSEEIQ